MDIGLVAPKMVQLLMDKKELKIYRREIMKQAKNIGSHFEDFLKEEGIQEEVEIAAIKSIVARNIKKYMKKNAITQTDMAKQLKTSRSGLERLLDPENYSVTLLTLNRAAHVIGKKVTIAMVSVEENYKQ